MQTIALIDYGSGNVRSVARALAEAARRAEQVVDIRLTHDPDFVAGADRIVLPGQGAFAQCIGALSADVALSDALSHAVRQRGAPFLGICVGAQLLMRVGLEDGVHEGLGWIDGVCTRLHGDVRLPHMGWNAVTPVRQHPVLDGLSPSRHMVFMHSFVVVPADAASVAATTDYGAPFVSAIAHDTIVGVQFHPEKSQAAGLDLLARFLKWSPA